MKTLKQHIQEAFKLGDDNFKSRNERKETDNNEVLEKIMNTFYIQNTLDSFWKEGFEDEDYYTIKDAIYEKFVKGYELSDPNKLMFVCRRGQCPKDYAKYYKKNNLLWNSYRRKLDNNFKPNYIWSKESLYFTINKTDKEAILGKHGPFGGLMICVYKF